ncbi:MAG: hypothetical protein VCD00_16365 [Candidatus Hydrogenedentota bacterium]
MVKKDNVHLKLTEELSEIDSELDDALEALSTTNQRIDAYLNGDEDPDRWSDATPATELPDVANEHVVESNKEPDAQEDASPVNKSSETRE